MKTLLTLLTVVLFFKAGSQTSFQRTFGDILSEYSFSAKQTSDKGYILAGYTESYALAANDYYLVKTDSLANVTWSKVYSGLNRDEAYCVQQTSDGGYILAGSSKSYGSLYYDACILKQMRSGIRYGQKVTEHPVQSLRIQLHKQVTADTFLQVTQLMMLSIPHREVFIWQN